jgi:hypothetical protein
LSHPRSLEKKIPAISAISTLKSKSECADYKGAFMA